MAANAIHDARRTRVRALIDERSPADALASYYGLHHPADRNEIFLHPEETSAPAAAEQAAEGFLVRAHTGMDLFRPLVTYRANNEAAAVDLFERGLPAGRPVYLSVPERLALWANKHLSITDADMHRIYRLNPSRHQPIINVLLTTSAGQDGHPRTEIRTGDRAGAVAGVNWVSPAFAEVYVYTEPAVRGRGWGKSVVSALVGQLLRDGLQPLYVVAESNEYSIRLAESVGFEDTGFREYAGQAVRTPAANLADQA